jgi:hypothetical protein
MAGEERMNSSDANAKVIDSAVSFAVAPDTPQTATPPDAQMREQVARIIDKGAWSINPRTQKLYLMGAERRTDALTKADAILALSPAWLPISSAPKDGTEVLVSTANSRGVFEHMAVASWDDTDEYGRCEPRWTIFSGKHHSPALDYHPTHWLPLPPPPASCGEGV